MRQDYLVLKSLVKIFGSGENAFKAVDNVNIEVQEGELVTLLGPSGCGKTTTLRMISGFELPTSGEIRIDGEDVSTTPPNQRPTTMVFQNYALFPHLTVFENIAYGLKIRRESAENIRAQTEKIMQLVGLEGLAERAPAQLSGGQQQRVSLARSLVMEPKVLLLDEPSMGLAPLLIHEIFNIITRLNQEEKISILLVEQNAKLALNVAPHAYVLENGRIVMDDSAEKLRENPDIKDFYLGMTDFGGRKSFRDVKHYKRRKRWLT